jgi:adenylosuccinate lyase
VHSQEASEVVKQQGKANDLIDRLKADESFAGVDLDGTLDASLYIGRAPEQVDAFISEHVEPMRARLNDDLASAAEEVFV